jgi:hypothetical protein
MSESQNKVLVGVLIFLGMLLELIRKLTQRDRHGRMGA